MELDPRNVGDSSNEAEQLSTSIAFEAENTAKAALVICLVLLVISAGVVGFMIGMFYWWYR